MWVVYFCLIEQIASFESIHFHSKYERELFIYPFNWIKVYPNFNCRADHHIKFILSFWNKPFVLQNEVNSFGWKLTRSALMFETQLYWSKDGANLKSWNATFNTQNNCNDAMTTITKLTYHQLKKFSWF